MNKYLTDALLIEGNIRIEKPETLISRFRDITAQAGDIGRGS